MKNKSKLAQPAGVVLPEFPEKLDKEIGLYMARYTEDTRARMRDFIREYATEAVKQSLAQPAPAQPVSVPEYTVQMGDAGEKYITSFGKEYKLPALFTWAGLFRAMLAATSQPAKESIYAVRICPDADRECGDYPKGWCATCPKRKQESGASEQDAKDAARYRFLRDGKGLKFADAECTFPADGSLWVVKYVHPKGTIPRTESAGIGDELDANIAAMQAEACKK